MTLCQECQENTKHDKHDVLFYDLVNSLIPEPFCPTCGNSLDARGVCNDCGYSDFGETVDWLSKYAVEIIRNINTGK